MPPQPSTTLRLRSPKRRLNIHIGSIVIAITPHARFPIRVLIVLLDVTRQGFDVVMDKRMDKFPSASFYDDVLMNFHVGHAGILILKAAFEPSQSLTE